METAILIIVCLVGLLEVLHINAQNNNVKFENSNAIKIDQLLKKHKQFCDEAWAFNQSNSDKLDKVINDMKILPDKQTDKPCKTPCVQCGSIDHDTLECKVKYVPVLRVGEKIGAVVIDSTYYNLPEGKFKKGDNVVSEFIKTDTNENSKWRGEKIYKVPMLYGSAHWFMSEKQLEFIRPESPKKPEQSGKHGYSGEIPIPEIAPESPASNPLIVKLVEVHNERHVKPKPVKMAIGDTCLAIRLKDKRKIRIKKMDDTFTCYMRKNGAWYNKTQVTLIPGTIKKGKK